MLDFQAIVYATWLQILVWGLMVAAPTLTGYPGVICVTPLGWLLGLTIGMRVAHGSRSPEGWKRIVEAGLGGVILGLFEGAVFAVVFGLEMTKEATSGAPVENGLATLLALAIAGSLSAIACALLAMLMVILALRRENPAIL